jgi:hypothetical protein
MEDDNDDGFVSYGYCPQSQAEADANYRFWQVEMFKCERARKIHRSHSLDRGVSGARNFVRRLPPRREMDFTWLDEASATSHWHVVRSGDEDDVLFQKLLAKEDAILERNCMVRIPDQFESLLPRAPAQAPSAQAPTAPARTGQGRTAQARTGQDDEFLSELEAHEELF